MVALDSQKSSNSDTDVEGHLSHQDPDLGTVIARVVDHFGEVQRFPEPTSKSHFAHLVRSIVYQQLSGKAAGTIHTRLVEGLAGDVTAVGLARFSLEQLRSFGLSRPKSGYLQALADRVVSGELQLEDLHQLDDQAVFSRLIQCKGIGEWTVQMFLMFHLRRQDILPALDLGVRKGFAVMCSQTELPTREAMLKRAERWSPWRSIAALYLWRILDV